MKNYGNWAIEDSNIVAMSEIFEVPQSCEATTKEVELTKIAQGKKSEIAWDELEDGVYIPYTTNLYIIRIQLVNGNEIHCEYYGKKGLRKAKSDYKEFTGTAVKHQLKNQPEFPELIMTAKEQSDLISANTSDVEYEETGNDPV